MAQLEQLSREELIQLVLASERTDTTVRRKKKKERPFDFGAYAKEHVAMKVAYLGWPFHGYASQISHKASAEYHEAGEMSSLPTVEEHLFRALMTTKLIENPTMASYSRCGRTDAGVSAIGQVIGVTIRTSRKLDVNETDGTVLPVATMLNGVLPPEIRVLEVVPAPEGFTARFDCKYREYHYYFPRQRLDTGAMRDAAALLLGEHDFRNFAKRDPSKTVQNYVRTIFKSHIEAISQGHEESPLDMFKYVIRGTAFLYHQVRCTMAVLFLVGQGKADLDDVRYLLETLDEEWRPTFQMASEIPLVLVECGFDKVQFSVAQDDRFNNAFAQGKSQRHFFGLWRDKAAQALTIQSLLQPDMIQNEMHPRVQTVLRKA